MNISEMMWLILIGSTLLIIFSLHLFFKVQVIFDKRLPDPLFLVIGTAFILACIASVLIQSKDYNTPLLFYTIVFFIALGGLFIVYLDKNVSLHKEERLFCLIAVLAFGLITRLYLATRVEGFPSDIACLKGWADIASRDLFNFYKSGSFVDYPPLYIYVLFLMGKLRNIATGIDFTLIIKLPAILADGIIALLLYKLAMKKFSEVLSILIAMAYIFNPVSILDTALWGQVDSFFTMIVLIGILLINNNRPIPSTVCFMAAILMKPQAAIFFPILIFDLLKHRGLITIMKSVGAAIATFVVITFPFSVNPTWMVRFYLKTFGEYNYASLNAFNFFSFFGLNLANGSDVKFIFSYNTWGLIFDAGLCLLVGYLYYKSKSKALPIMSALLLIAGAFTLSSKMHERYMFPVIAIALAAFAYTKNKKILAIFAGYTFTNFFNIDTVLYRMLTLNYPHVSPKDPLLMVISFVNILLFAYVLVVTYEVLLPERQVHEGKEQELKP